MRHAPSGKVRLCGMPPREESFYAASTPRNGPPCGIETAIPGPFGRDGTAFESRQVIESKSRRRASGHLRCGRRPRLEPETCRLSAHWPPETPPGCRMGWPIVCRTSPLCSSLTCGARSRTTAKWIRLHEPTSAACSDLGPQSQRREQDAALRRPPAPSSRHEATLAGPDSSRCVPGGE